MSSQVSKPDVVLSQGSLHPTDLEMLLLMQLRKVVFINFLLFFFFIFDKPFSSTTPCQTKRSIISTGLGNGVKVAMFNEGKTLHLERLVVADRHPGVHLRKTRVGVHEEV